MATIEYCNYIPHQIIVSNGEKVEWLRDNTQSIVKSLPMIFWGDGSPWIEANLWAHSRATNGITDLKTVHSDLGHLHKYANWLEKQGLEWRHFPLVQRERILIRWRKYLIEQRDDLGLLKPSTTSHRMNATIKFYRYAHENNFIGQDAPMWREHQVVHSFHDAHGFVRTMTMKGTDLAIHNRARHGLTLEEGITPLTQDQMIALLNFTGNSGKIAWEIDLMLKIGFFSGPRIETITDLKLGTLDNAVSDPNVPGLYYLSVGPGYLPNVATKFDVQGQIMMPAELLNELRTYAADERRLKRELLAAPQDKDLVFLTRFGHRYSNREVTSGTAINGAMTNLRREATSAGLKFAEYFYFHMTRATFGTLLTSLLLDQQRAKVKDVLALVRDAMLHKDESTTLKYVKFVQESPIKQRVASKFTECFIGISTARGKTHA